MGFIILAVILAVIIVILLIPIRAVLSYDGKTEFYIKIMFIKIPIGKRAKKEKKQAAPKNDTAQKSGGESKIKKLLSLKDDISEFAEFVADRCFYFERLSVKLDFGTGNAAYTGLACGPLNALVYSAIGLIHSKTLLKDWDVMINPDFNSARFDLVFLCIGGTRLVHIIRVGIKGLKLYKKIK